MKNKLLVTALSTGLALGASLQSAQAGESLLFPFYLSGNGIYTFLMLHDIFGNGTPGSVAKKSLHYIWNTQTPNGNCVHEDADGALTPFDLVQQTVAGPGLPGNFDLQAIFGDKSQPNFSLLSPATGFMIVRSSQTAVVPGGNDGSPTEGDFRGQAIIVDTTNGTVASYKGFNNPTSVNEGTWNNVVVSHPSYDLTWYPTTAAGSSLGAGGVDTAWFVIVTGGHDTSGNPAVASADPGLANPDGWKGSVTLRNGWISGVRDRDENPRSGGLTPVITCEGFVRLADMLSAQQVTSTANGGYAWEVATLNCDGNAGKSAGACPVTIPSVPSGISATGILMSKIETTIQFGPRITTVSQENAFPNIPY